jgi:protein gp37
MAEHSKIEWTDATWNPITGCSIISPGCTNCYAMRLAGTRLKHHPSRAGLTRDSKAGPVWTGKTRMNEEWLTQPLTWRRPRRIFVCAHGDLFHESVPDEWIDKVFAVMAMAPQHTFQVLTKRAARMLEYLTEGPWGAIEAECAELIGGDDVDAWQRADAATDPSRVPLPNVILGVSAEDQTRSDERRDHLGPLARKHGWRTFVSYEPALGPVDWTGWEFLDWMISGGESQTGSRPSHPDWHRAARDFCAANGVPYHFKQWGDWVAITDRDRDDPDWRADYRTEKTTRRILNLAGGGGFHGERVHLMERVGKSAAGRLLDGVEHNGMPRVHT